MAASFELKYDVRTSAPTVAKFHRSNADFKAIKGPIGCLSADTEFLTPTGWKRIDEYKPEDKVAQWRQNGTIEFVTPGKYIVQPCRELIKFSNKSLSMVVSDEHRMPLYKWDGEFVVKQAAAVAARPSSHKVPTRIAPVFEDTGVQDEYLRLMVAINADAHHYKAGFKSVITIRKDRKKHRLRWLFAECGIEYTEYTSAKRPTETSFRFVSEYKGKTFEGEFWWGLSLRQLQVVLDEMSHWDGLYEGSDTRFHSANKCDADFIQYAAYAVGGKATISTTTYPGKRWRDTYIVHIAVPGSLKAATTLRVDSVKIERVPSEDGRKYCFSVPTSFFVARHNGCVFVTGNSGKSVACCIEIFRRCQEQLVGPDGFRRSRWVVVRNTKQQLKDTTLKTWFDWFPAGVGVGYWKETDATYYLEFNDVKAEILFRALDTPADVAKVLSLELTGAWLNECREINQEIVEGLQGRLERYPSQKMGGSNYWMLIADTNPPQLGSYWWKIFEHQPLEDGDQDTVVECDTFSQPSGISAQAENLVNLNPGYYARKAKGRSKSFINVFIKAQYSLSLAGKPVYLDSFVYSRHVSKTSLPIHPFLPIIIGQDFGLTPAGLWMQMQEDGRIFILRETPAFNMGIKRYIKSKFNPMHKSVFPTNPIIVIGDPSGTRRADSDEGTCFKEFKKAHIPAKGAYTNDMAIRIQVFDDLFSEYPDMQPKVLIDPACKTFIRAMQTEYKYKRKKLSVQEEYDDKPDKSASCSHLVEGGQYGAMFLTSSKYDPSDFTVYDEFNPLNMNTMPRGPAQAEGY